MKEKNKKKMLANELTDVKDIKNGFLYTKSGYVIGYLRIFSINISLLSKAEKGNKANTLTSEFNAEKQEFTLFSIPRTVDMDIYLTSLITLADEEVSNPYRKKVLKIMIKDASEEVIRSKNYEHQYFLRVWCKYDPSSKDSERKVTERLNDMINRYNSIQNETKRLNEVEILKINNLYNNNNTASMEGNFDSVQYYPLSMIDEGN